jgi:tetratricopeptide (TPR) repeat protein
MNDIEDIFREAVDHHNAGRLHEASQGYQRVLAMRPNDAACLHLLGTIAYQLGRSDIAVNLVEAAVRIDGEVAAFHNDLGEIYRVLGRTAEAMAEFRRALALAPDMGSATNNLAILLQGERQLDAALALYRRAVELLPDAAEIRMNYGVALLESGQPALAAQALTDAMSLAPQDAAVRLNLGNVRMAEDRPQEAASEYAEALKLQPAYALAQVNLGRALRELGRPAEALPHYAAALAIDPALETARWNEGACRLLLGDFVRGWKGFARRFRAGAVPPHGLDAPEWEGEQLLGRRVLVHAEQGLGDTLQFVRFMALLAPFGAGEVTLLAQAPLVKLLNSNRIRTIGPEDTLPEHDLRVPLLDLPRLLGIDLTSLPGKIPYLKADRSMVALCRAMLARTLGKRVGLVWQGRRDHANDRNRSIPPALLAPLLDVPGIAWISLQRDAEPLAEPAVNNLAPWLADMADTAAAIAALDLVVTVDTSVAHLAGALGKPVWILLPFAPDWRWMIDRTDSPWYPSARLFRQQVAGDWQTVIAAVVAALSSDKKSDRRRPK